MRTFQNALPAQLTKRERILFEHLHLPQPYLGGLPMVLLAPRLGFIRELLWELWEQLPDKHLVPVLYRLLYYYASMAARRREADQVRKRPPPVQFVESAYVPKEKSQVFQDIAAEVRELRGIDCGCPQRQWWAELEKVTPRSIRIHHYCVGCPFDFNTTTDLTLKEFIEIGQSIGLIPRDQSGPPDGTEPAG
jgi:hypothetical protein